MRIIASLHLLCLTILPLMKSSLVGTNRIFLISGYGGVTVTLQFLVNSKLRLVSNGSVLFLWGMRNIALAGMSMTYMANIRSPTMLFLMKLLLVGLVYLVPCHLLLLFSHLLLVLLAIDPIFVPPWVTSSYQLYHKTPGNCQQSDMITAIGFYDMRWSWQIMKHIIFARTVS